MTPDEYSKWRHTTDQYPQDVTTPAFYGLGLCGETGEVAEKIKKLYRDGTPLEPAKIAYELGDVLWYLTAIADDMGYTLQEIIDLNVQKLEDRRKRGTFRGSGDNR